MGVSLLGGVAAPGRRSCGLFLRPRLAVAVSGGGPWRGRSGGGGGLWVRVEGRERPGATVC